MNGIQGAKIALLIDFDNVILGVEDPGFDVELVVNALRARGIVVMGRAYGDWYRHHRHRRKLMEQGIELVETPVFGPIIKNSADIRIVLDGIDVALAHSHIDTFCLVSGDSDFLPLIKRLQLLGKNVIVIAGQKFTSELVRRNCNEYIAYENLFAESIGATDDVSTLDGACQLLQRAINTLLERGMDARSSTVKQMMLQMNPAFSERTFGCSQFKQFLDKATRTGVVKLGDRDSHTGEYAVLLMENGAVVEAPEKSAPREDTSPRRRGRERTPREPKTETASTRSEAPRENAAPESAAPLAIEDELLAESGAAFSTGEKAQTRGTLRRGRLKFSAKSGVSAAAPVAPQSPESALEDAAAKSKNVAPGESAPGETEAPREYSQTAAIESAPEAAATENQTGASDAPASAESEENAAPKKRTTRGGRRRKPKSENGDSAASAEKSASEESATELDGAATSLGDLKAATAAAPETPENEAAAPEQSDETAPAATGENAAADDEKPAPKKRATRGGRRKKPAAEKAADEKTE